MNSNRKYVPSSEKWRWKSNLSQTKKNWVELKNDLISFREFIRKDRKQTTLFQHPYEKVWLSVRLGDSMM